MTILGLALLAVACVGLGVAVLAKLASERARQAQYLDRSRAARETFDRIQQRRANSRVAAKLARRS